MDKKPIYKKWWFWVIILIALAAIGGMGTTTTDNNADGDQSTSEIVESNNDKKYGLMDKFEFDGFELSIGPGTILTTIKNEFSDKDNASVVQLPVTIKNVSGDTKAFNMFYYTMFGSSGSSLDKVGAYFMDSDVDNFGEIRDGGEVSGSFHLLYDGNGTYAIEFKKPLDDNKIILEFDVDK